MVRRIVPLFAICKSKCTIIWYSTSNQGTLTLFPAPQLIDLMHICEIPSLRRSVDIDSFLYSNNICCQTGEIRIEETRAMRHWKKT